MWERWLSPHKALALQTPESRSVQPAQIYIDNDMNPASTAPRQFPFSFLRLERRQKAFFPKINRSSQGKHLIPLHRDPANSPHSHTKARPHAAFLPVWWSVKPVPRVGSLPSRVPQHMTERVTCAWACDRALLSWRGGGRMTRVAPGLGLQTELELQSWWSTAA